MNLGIMQKTVEDLEDIKTVLCVVVHNDELDEAELRACAKGALEMVHNLQRDLLAVMPDPAEASAPKSN